MLPAEQGGGLQGGGVEPDDQVGDHLGAVDQQRVFEEQRIIVGELGAQCAAQQACPQLTLEPHRGIAGVFGVQRRQGGAVQRVRRAGGPEPRGDLVGRRGDTPASRQHTFQPELQRCLVSGDDVHDVSGRLGERAAPQLVGPPLSPVGQHPDVALTGLCGAGSHVAGELGFCG